MILFISFIGLLLNLGAGGLIKELSASNYFFSISASCFYLHFLITHIEERGISLLYFIWFIALLIVVGGIAKAKEGEEFNFIGCLAILDCIATLIALIAAIVTAPKVGIFY